MVAAFFELDHGFASETALPASFFGRFDEPCGFRVVWTGAGFVPCVVAGDADFGAAFTAATVFAPLKAR